MASWIATVAFKAEFDTANQIRTDQLKMNKYTLIVHGSVSAFASCHSLEVFQMHNPFLSILTII